MEIIRADEAAQRSNLQLIGIYHSHPDALPQPSQVDLEHGWPWYIYLVVAIEKGRSTGVQAWQLNEDGSTFRPVDLQVTEDE
jgi:proteasome lid subunit RPN8/RPN11